MFYVFSTPLGYSGTQHAELFSQTPFPAVVTQEVSSNGSILAQPSPYKNFPSYPTSVILSPAKNRKLHQRNETTVNSVPSMSPLVTVTSSLSHLTAMNLPSSVASSNISHPPMPAAPPPLDIAMQPCPSNIQNPQNGGIPNSTLSHSSITMEAQLPYSYTSNGQVVGNKSAVPKDPSTALIEQHNVRVVPAVLSFGSLFSSSTRSTSQHSISQSNAPVNNNTSFVSSTSIPSLFKPSDVYNSPSIGHLDSTISWLHPNRPLFTDTNSSSQWTSDKSVQSHTKVITV